MGWQVCPNFLPPYTTRKDYMPKFIHKSKLKENFSILPNSIVERNDMSSKAKGILWYLLSKPENWQTNMSDIENHMKESASAVASGIKELENLKYLVKERVKGKNGKFDGWDYFVYDSPTCDFPISEKPISDNRALISTDIQVSTDNTNNIYMLGNKETYNNFIMRFNKLLSTHYKGNDKTRHQLNARVADGYTVDDILKATKNASLNKFLMGDNQNSKRYLTPEYITRADKLDDWFNCTVEESKDNGFNGSEWI